MAAIPYPFDAYQDYVYEKKPISSTSDGCDTIMTKASTMKNSNRSPGYNIDDAGAANPLGCQALTPASDPTPWLRQFAAYLRTAYDPPTNLPMHPSYCCNRLDGR